MTKKRPYLICGALVGFFACAVLASGSDGDNSKCIYETKFDKKKPDSSVTDIYAKSLDVKLSDDPAVSASAVADYLDVVQALDSHGKIQDSPEAVRKLIKFYKKYKENYPMGAIRNYFYSQLEIKPGCPSPKWNDTVLSSFKTENGLAYHSFHTLSIPNYFTTYILKSTTSYEKKKIESLYSFFFCFSSELYQTGETQFVDSVNSSKVNNGEIIKYFRERYNAGNVKKKVASLNKMQEIKNKIWFMDYSIQPILDIRNKGHQEIPEELIVSAKKAVVDAESALVECDLLDDNAYHFVRSVWLLKNIGKSCGNKNIVDFSTTSLQKVKEASNINATRRWCDQALGEKSNIDVFPKRIYNGMILLSGFLPSEIIQKVQAGSFKRTGPDLVDESDYFLKNTKECKDKSILLLHPYEELDYNSFNNK